LLETAPVPAPSDDQAVPVAPARAAGPALGWRCALLLFGSGISTFCYAVTVRAGLGLGPLYAVQDGLARHAGITIGHAVMAVGVVLLVLAVALRSWPGLGTVALPFIGGAALDLVLPRLPALHGEPLRFGAVVAASWVSALGGACIIRAAVGIAPLDAVMLGLHRILGGRLMAVRLGMEATMLVGGWFLGGSIGVGTVVTGLLIGPALQFWLNMLGSDTARRGRP
jgi:uncharacterized membrane protein YczE